jgi:NADH:flavin oxidoreductases, Old Yellow Enzyme family
MKDLRTLFSPVTIATMELRNRIAMAPIGADFATPEGQVTETMLGYYEARAKGGVALIFVEVTSVVGSLKYMPNQLGLWNDKFILEFERDVKLLTGQLDQFSHLRDIQPLQLIQNPALVHG